MLCFTLSLVGMQHVNISCRKGYMQPCGHKDAGLLLNIGQPSFGGDHRARSSTYFGVEFNPHMCIFEEIKGVYRVFLHN